MSTNSNDRGRAYEYAWINSLHAVLQETRETEIVRNTSLEANERAWSALDEDLQDVLSLSSDSAVDTLIEMEPRMIEDDGDVLLLELQKDQAAIEGDVRDLLIKRDAIEWEVGLSIKHNNDAVKHSRLGQKLDFGNEWFGTPCSKEYWAAIDPIFARLREEKDKGTKWSDLEDKEDSVYVPLLEAFEGEVWRAYKRDSSLPEKMIEYLIGANDYYKTVSRDDDRFTLIQTFNIHGTLNKPSKVQAPTINAPVVALPTELVALKFKTDSKNTLEMYLNNGWQLSFRIHNASSKVEPSLKFDIRFIGMPVTVLTIECKWKERS